MERRSNINTSQSSRRSSMKRRNTSQEEYRQSTSSLYKQRSKLYIFIEEDEYGGETRKNYEIHLDERN